MRPTVEMACPCYGIHPCGNGVEKPRRISSSDNAKSNRPTVHTDQANQAAGAAAHTTDFLPLFLCPFCHNTTTLQQYRLYSVRRIGC
jgi:hypothetical protein